MRSIDFRSEPHDEFEQRAVRRRVDRGELVRIRPGAFVPAGHESAEARHLRLVVATSLRLSETSTVSHISAAIVHGLPVLRSRIGPVTLSRPGSNGGRSRYLHARRATLESHEVVEAGGVRTTSIARTVADLAKTLPFDEALAAADVALRLGVNLSVAIDREAASARVRRVIDHASPLADSMGESMSRAVFIRAGVPAGELQFAIRDGSGRRIAVCDFGWPEQRVVGEFDGALKYSGALQGHGNPERVILDEKRREERIREQGYDLVRWGWETMRDARRLVARVERALDIGGYRAGHPLPEGR